MKRKRQQERLFEQHQLQLPDRDGATWNAAPRNKASYYEVTFEFISSICALL